MSVELKINQKEYLKKYLSGEKKKPKKKKDNPKDISRVKIVDDDISIHNFKVQDDDELILTGEDAPQIVGIVDDRPPELRTVEDFRSSGKWKSIFMREENHISDSTKRRKEDASDLKSEKQVFREGINKNELIKNTIDDDDLSPPRKHKRPIHPDIQKRQENDTGDSSSDYSPPRRTQKHKRSSEDFDDSRKKSEKHNTSYKRSDRLNFKNRNSDSPLITQRQTERSRSPEKTHRSKSRKSRDDNSSSEKQSSKKKSTSKSKSSDDDYSPVRRKSTYESLTGKNRQSGYSKDSDDPPDFSLKNSRSQELKASRDDTQYIRKSEDDTRGRKTDKKEILLERDQEINVRNKQSMIQTQSEIELKKAKDYKEQKKKETYDRWGVGLKQIDDYKNKIASEMYESSKPLARYSDDADLDEMLRKQERAGDPMLAYIRERDKEKNKESKTVNIPVYNGPFPENRFNIKPGYRWDGVDRSNGYEKKWFDMQNQKRALQEEAYRYSTEDM